MLDFIEPRPSPLLISLVKFLYPLYITYKYGKLRIELKPEVRKLFRAHTAEPVIVCANHCAEEDADVLFGISRLVREQFNFLAARELFESSYSDRKKWMQSLGCYSIERGLPDLRAFKSSEELLLQPHEKVVILPEGEISHQNDFLMPLENGVEHIALASLQERRKSGSTKSIYILPLALKYRYGKDVRKQISSTLAQIERTLGLVPDAHKSAATRLRNSYVAMLEVLERAHLLPESQGSLDDRIFALREQLIHEGEMFLHLELPVHSSQLSRLHMLKDTFAARRWGRVFRALSNTAECALSDSARYSYDAVRLAIDLVAIGEHSFDHDLSQEEAAELTRVLAHEVSQNQSLPSPDLVLVGAAEAIDVADFFDLYQRDRRQGIKALKSELEHRLAHRLHALESGDKPKMMVGGMAAKNPAQILYRANHTHSRG